MIFHPKLNDLLYKAGFSEEVPDSPMFPHIFDEDDEELQFVPEAGDDLRNVLRQPQIGNCWWVVSWLDWFVAPGLEKDVQYNDHELPTQLSPDQYFKLQWALSDERQELVFDGEKEDMTG